MDHVSLTLIAVLYSPTLHWHWSSEILARRGRVLCKLLQVWQMVEWHLDSTLIHFGNDRHLSQVLLTWTFLLPLNSHRFFSICKVPFLWNRRKPGPGIWVQSFASLFRRLFLCVVLGSIGTARREKKGTILVSDRKHTASASVSRYFLFSLILFPPPFFTLLRSPLFYTGLGA
jgi:hypothetical protein